MTDFNSYMGNIDTDFFRELCLRNGELRYYKRNEFILREGEVGSFFGFILSGVVKYSCTNRTENKPYNVGFSFPNEFIADYPTCLYGMKSELNIQAIIPCEIYICSSTFLQQKFKENNKILLEYFQGIEMLSLNEKAALNGIITTSSTKEIPLEFVRRTIADSLSYNPDVEGINIISTIITFRVLHSSIGFLLRSGNCNEAEEVCKKVIEILDLIDITLSHIKPTFAVHTYILLAQIKLAQNKVEGVELANKCIRQIDASIDLYNSTKEINNRKDYVDRFYELNKTGVEFDF